MEIESSTASAGSPAKLQSRLPSLNNLLESEVILGGDDDMSSCDGDDSEMHSALEELSESASTATADFKFLDCSLSSSVAEAETSAVEAEADSTLTGQPDSIDLNLSFSQSFFQESNRSANEEMSMASLTQSYYRDRPSPSRPMIPRSSSSVSTVSYRPTSRLASPRQPSYADNTTCSKNRVSSASPVAYAARRSVNSAPPTMATTPTSGRKPSSYPASPRPAVPPKPATLSRQTSTLRSTKSESPMTPRRSTSVTAPPGVKMYAASGRQASVIRSSAKPLTPTKPATPIKSLTPPRRDERFATLGRRPSRLNSPPSAGASPSSSAFSTSASMESSLVARDTKAAADKFATLPRRKPAKDRPPIPKFGRENSELPAISARIEAGATLPRPKKAASPPSSILKPKVVIYMEKSAQTELSTDDVQDGQEAALRLRSLTWHQQHNEEARQLERMLQQSHEECVLLRQELDEEREERQLVQQELDRTTKRVTAMLNSMEGVEKEFHSRGDISNSIIMHLENNLQSSSHAISALQEQLEAQDAALIAQRLELDKCLMTEKALLQQLQENESESREMMEFLQAEKVALSDAVRDSETEVAQLKSKLEECQCQLQLKEEECQHLVRLAEQRRHELAALQVDLKGSEIRNGSVLIAQGAQISAAAESLLHLHSRMDGLLKALLQSHSLPEAETPLTNGSHCNGEELPALPASSPPKLEDVETSLLNDSASSQLLNLSNLQLTDKLDQDHVQMHPLAGSASLQDLSDAINLTRRRPPEGREEPSSVVNEKLLLAASLVDQIEEADSTLSKLLQVLQRLIFDKDSTLQQLSDEKEQFVASLSAQSIALQEAKEELNKLRRHDGVEAQEQITPPQKLKKVSPVPGFGPYYDQRQSWNDLSAPQEAHWTQTLTQVLDTLPSDILHAHPPLQQLLHNLISDASHDPNANGSG